MNKYEKLGTLAVRWMAVGFFLFALVSALFATTMGMGGTMRAGTAGMSGHMGGTMQGGAFMWWGPALVSLVIGLLLWVVSRPVGRAMASGLADSRVEDVRGGTAPNVM